VADTTDAAGAASLTGVSGGTLREAVRAATRAALAQWKKPAAPRGTAGFEATGPAGPERDGA
ncbi:hypothetical protein, partial [Achromobacter xylosoxidans]|uniref:hypothetical protein n=1 Tax=Alcaligenes xylosoxydans xylosoxydans TaxID=85698 RepID=UPI001E5CDC7F